ncbi:hypothetical protein QTP88_016625 [Uroleucon formosanum]
MAMLWSKIKCVKISTTGSVKKRVHRKTLETTENCTARATTDCVNGVHKLRSTPTDHNHSHRTKIIYFRSDIKKQAHSTRDKPLQILQEVISNIPLSIRPYLPGPEAVRKIIKRRRRKSLPAEPTTLKDINIPESLRNTFAGELFILRESKIENDKILIFSTKFEIEKLVRAKFLIMGEFSRQSQIYVLQMYTIHAPVGGINSRILLLVYILGQAITIVMNLIQPVLLLILKKQQLMQYTICFQNMSKKGAFFIWYRMFGEKFNRVDWLLSEHFNLKLRYIPALAFLEPNEILAAFNETKQYIPIEIYSWFDETYVNGKIPRTFRNVSISRSPPLFPPEFWSISHNDKLDIPRTQNKVESWLKRWKTLIETDHIVCLHIVSEMKKEQKNTIGQTELKLSGEPKLRQHPKYAAHGREDVEDDERSGRPSTSIIDENVKKVEKMVMNDRRITIREVADDVGISIGSCHNIFSNVLGMKRVAAKFIPKLLNFDQKNNHMKIAQELLNDINDDPSLLERVITGDETWVYSYE